MKREYSKTPNGALERWSARSMTCPLDLGLSLLAFLWK